MEENNMSTPHFVEVEPSGNTSGCLSMIAGALEPLTPSGESEFDDELGVPDSIIVCSANGERVLMEADGKIDVDSGASNNVVIPFNSIHEPAVKFKSLQRKVFIPSIEIKVQITHHERSVTTHLLNPNLYTIRFEHGDFVWTVKKRYKHIHHLHQQLRLFRASLNIPFPTKSHREKRSSFRNNVEKQKGKKRGALPRFPNKPEALVPYEQIGQRIKQLEDYLYNLLNINIYRNHYETIYFLQVSQLSFIYGLGMKGKEGSLLKKTGSTQPGQAGCNFCGLIASRICVRCNYFCKDVLCSTWRERWFFVKETSFGYIRPKDGRIKCVILFDQGFEVSTGMYSAGLHNGLQIQTQSRQIGVRCWTKRKSKEWQMYLKETAYNKARDFTHPNQHGSFAPMRSNITAYWFVDGSSYMSAVADALEAAREEIFIADWWLSPEIFMKRPAIDGEYWRLDKILQRKARQGVKIFVLLYKEVELALGINSFYSKQRLVNLNQENIKVLRHPDHARVGVYLWAHHEKIVVIDQSYAFLGGIDLCYGRWDDHKHRLTDLGSISFVQRNMPSKKKKTSSSPAGDNGNVHSFHKLAAASNLITVGVLANEDRPVINVELPPEEPPTPPPMPDELLFSQPVTEGMKCNTPEMERKNPLGKLKANVKTKTMDFMHKLAGDDQHETAKNPRKLDINKAMQLKESGFSIDESKDEINTPKTSELDVRNNLTGAKLWIGKDYTNFIVKDFIELDEPLQDFVDRNTTPRMPWHDIGVMVQGPSARDVARHFIQRWNATKLEKAQLNPMYPYLLPKSYSHCTTVLDIINEESHDVTCQILRSASSWSAGFLDPETVEQSIHEAYVDSIRRADHYIYIENQFFVTLAMGNIDVRNQIGDALYKRILRAYREKSVFRVYVVMPLLPGFEGEVGGATGTALHAVTHWNYASISRGKDAILNKLRDAGIEDPSEYITFCGLRTHSTLNGEPVTELIYVHSKLMIIDDRTVICGSANINDRSLIGIRDSEIAVIIKDESFMPGTMNGTNFPSGKFAGSLRKHLFKEHLGLLEGEQNSLIDVTDPVTYRFYKDVWCNIAASNTEIYEDVFHCIPSDKVPDFVSLKRYQSEQALCNIDIDRAKQMLQNIKGHLVLLPLNFLCNETLTPASRTVEGLMPTALWT